MMEEENKEASQESNFFDTEALSRAADESLDRREGQLGDEVAVVSPPGEGGKQAGAEKQEPETPIDKVPVEPEDNRERSQLGRKVTALERQLQEQTQLSTQLMEAFQYVLQSSQAPQAAQPTRPQEQEEEEYLDLTDPKVLKQFVLKVKSEEEAQTQQKRQLYERTYLTTLDKISRTVGDDPQEIALHKETVRLTKEDKSPFNVMLTGNAEFDAERNYNAAQRHILRQMIKRGENNDKRNPLEKNAAAGTVTPPMGKIASGQSASRRTVTLGASETELAKFFGLSDERIEKALKRK